MERIRCSGEEELEPKIWGRERERTANNRWRQKPTWNTSALEGQHASAPQTSGASSFCYCLPSSPYLATGMPVASLDLGSDSGSNWNWPESSK